jgi:hypothetical protein
MLQQVIFREQLLKQLAESLSIASSRPAATWTVLEASDPADTLGDRPLSLVMPAIACEFQAYQSIVKGRVGDLFRPDPVPKSRNGGKKFTVADLFRPRHG